MKLTYKLIYTPSRNSFYSVEESNINFVCSDKRIHVRLRDYDKEEVIRGFINKLTYLVTYLVNYVEGSDSARFSSDDELLKSATKNINLYLGYNIGNLIHVDDFKGLKISKNYRRLKEFNPLGSIPSNLCPYSNSGESNSLSFFLKAFNINIHDFLFNDAYEIVITKDKDSKMYQKFLNKQNKTKKEVKEERVALW